MIDLHCHILAALDDGPQTVAESLKMAWVFDQAGYRVVSATPHMVPGTAWMPTVDRIHATVAGLNQAIKDEKLRLEIVCGMEIALDPQIPDLLDAGRLLPLGNASYLLIEPAFQQLPQGWEQIVFAIQAKGYSILLAHPERCLQLGTDPKLVDQLIASGVYLQASWGSFLGQYGRSVARTARRMVSRNGIHCLATDSHNPRGHTPDRINRAAAELCSLVGEKNLKRLTKDNPLRVLKGEPLQPMERSGEKTDQKNRPWWQFLNRLKQARPNAR